MSELNPQYKRDLREVSEGVAYTGQRMIEYCVEQILDLPTTIEDDHYIPDHIKIRLFPKVVPDRIKKPWENHTAWLIRIIAQGFPPRNHEEIHKKISSGLYPTHRLATKRIALNCFTIDQARLSMLEKSLEEEDPSLLMIGVNLHLANHIVAQEMSLNVRLTQVS